MPAEHPPQPIRDLVLQLRSLGVDPGLLERIESVLPQHQGDAEHWAELAAVMRRLGNYAAAQAVYDAALRMHGGSALLWNNHGILLRDWGKLGEALNAFDRAIELDPGYARPLENKGKILEMAHRFGEARAHYQAALALEPHNPRATNNIGVCLLGEGDAPQAEAWFQKAVELDPDFSDALFNLAALRLESGDLGAARGFIDRLSRLLPDDPDVGTLRAQLENADRTPRGVAVPPVRPLDGDTLSPEVRALCDQLAGNPRSIFISYAWADSATRAFAARLSRDLAASSFHVVLDQEHDLEVDEILALLLHCQNVILLNDGHYAESCLLGQVPITKPTFPYPSFAFPASAAASEAYMAEVFKVSAVVWEFARQLKDRGIEQAAEMAVDLARPEAFDRVPGLRVFIEGWRVDEAQLVFLNYPRYRSITMAYLGGEHCLAGYPLVDFSDGAYYATSFAALLAILGVGGQLTVDDAPIPLGKPDWRNYRWPDSSIVSARLWKIADEEVVVWRPSITPSGDVAALINTFKDWEPL